MLNCHMISVQKGIQMMNIISTTIRFLVLVLTVEEFVLLPLNCYLFGINSYAMYVLIQLIYI